MKTFVAFLLAVFCFTSPVKAEMLIGMIQYHEVEGRIGVRVNHSGRVHKVHPNSPAETAGIREGDVITSVDGHHDVNKIHGTVGTLVSLTVRREDNEFAVDVPRIDFREIKPFQ